MSIGELAVIALKNYGLDARWEENDYGMMSVFVYNGLEKSELTQREVMVWSKRVCGLPAR